MATPLSPLPSNDSDASSTRTMSENVQVLLETPRGRTAVVRLPLECLQDSNNEDLMCHLIQAARARDLDQDECDTAPTMLKKEDARHLMLLHQGRPVDPLHPLQHTTTTLSLQLKCRGRGGMDRQNRVGSKFGGGGVSSSQNAERERKDRLKRLALESIDLAKDPYLMRNHLGTYECKLCLTLHTNEANYLSHTQGKKHQHALAKRAHMEQLKQEKEAAIGGSMPVVTHQQPKIKKIRIGRPAYQVFKSRDSETNQRCLSFELHYPEIETDLQPRHRFMSAFEQRVEAPPDRRFQYLLFAADPYETVAFKIPNEPIDKSQDKFVTHWDADDRKFTVTLYFLDNPSGEEAMTEEDGGAVAAGVNPANPYNMYTSR